MAPLNRHGDATMANVKARNLSKIITLCLVACGVVILNHEVNSIPNSRSESISDVHTPVKQIDSRSNADQRQEEVSPADTSDPYTPSNHSLSLQITPSFPEEPLEMSTPNLWIHVEEFSEGMSTWRLSFAEILIVAQRLNATVVEPCIGGGRLRTCRDARFSLRNVYDMERLKRFHPYIVSFQDYERMLVSNPSPITLSMCLQKPDGSPPALMVCGSETPNMFKATYNPILEQAVLHSKNSTTNVVVIRIKYYRFGGFRTTKVGRRRVLLHGMTPSVLNNYFEFERYHYDAVDRALQYMGIDNASDFDVIHWRAELPNIDHNGCATKILHAKHAMSSNNTVLISSINRRAPLQWNTPYRQQIAVDSLNRLSEAGIVKMDDILDELFDKVKDPVVLAVWDQIVALKARRFVTCGRNCRSRKQHLQSCVSCNYLGNFAQMAIDVRLQHQKSSDDCWPV